MANQRELQILRKGREVGKSDDEIRRLIELDRQRVPDQARTIGADTAALDTGALSKLTSTLGAKFGERRERIAAATERQKLGEQTGAETFLQKAGETAGGALDIALEGLKAVTPDKLEETIKSKVAGFFPDFARSPLGQALNLGTEKFEELSPRAQDNVRATIELLTVAPVTRGARVAVETVQETAKVTAPVVKKAAEKGAEKVEKRLAAQVSRDALVITSPTLSKTDKIAALESGRGNISKITRDVKIQPSSFDIKVAKAVEDVVKPSNNFTKNIDAVRGKIESSSEKVGEKLRGNNTIFNTNQVRAKLGETKEGSRVIFGTDKALEKNYDAVIDEFIRILDKNPKTLEGLWKTRKEFDVVIKKKFPNVFEKFGGDTVRSNAIQDVREAANNFIAEKLPKGSAFREELFTISDMFTARKNIAKGAADLVDVKITDKVMRIIRANPITSFATGGIVTLGALTGLIASPLVIGALVTVGAVKLGQKIITARVLKESLSKGLRTLEGKLKPDEKAAIEELISQLDSAPVVTTIGK